MSDQSKTSQEPIPVEKHDGDEAVLRFRTVEVKPKTDQRSQLQFEVLQIPNGGTVHRSSTSGTQTLSNWMGYAIVVLVILAAIPAGSNRPLPWMFWSGIIFFLHAAHLLALSFISADRPLRIMRDRQWIAPLIGLVFCVGISLQAIPLPSPLLGLGQHAFDWGVVQTPSISVAPSATLLGLIRVLGYISLFSLTLEVSARGQWVDRLGWLLVIGVTLHAAWGLVSLKFLGDVALWGEKTSYHGVATGTFINRNSFATFLGMGFMIGLALVLDRINVPRVRKARSTEKPRMGLAELTFLSAGLGVILLAIIATQSRMGFASTTLGAISVYLMMRVASGSTIKRTLIEAFSAGAAIFVISVTMVNSSFFDRFLYNKGTIGDRLMAWQQTLEMILARPFTGIGWDAFAPAFELFHRPPLNTAFTWEYPHSTYLTLWAEAGFFLGSLPLLAAVVVLWRTVGNLKQFTSHYAIPIASIGIFLQIAAHSLVDFSMEIQANMFLFIVIVAMGSAARRVNKRAK